MHTRLGLNVAYLLSSITLSGFVIQHSLAPSKQRHPSAQSECVQSLKVFLKYKGSAGQKIMAKYRTRRGLSILDNFKKLRQWSLYHLQVKHGHDYPSIAIDEAPRAYGWSKSVYGKLSDGDADLLRVSDIPEELLENIKKVENYKKDLESFVDEAENLTLKIKAYEGAVAKGKKGQGWDIELSFPQIERNADGKAIEILDTDFRGTLAGLAIGLKNAREDFAALQRKVNARGAEQVALLLKLETFRKEFRRVATDNPNVELPFGIVQIIAKIHGLYQEADLKTGFRSELSPPRWAWENMKWAQWWGEVKSIITHDIPALKDKSKLNKLVQYISGLSPEEKRMLSLDNAADSISWYKRYKPIRLILSNPWTAGGAGVSIGSATTWAWSTLTHDSRKKEECAGASIGSDEFVNCGLEYLEMKFPRQSRKAEKDLRSLFNATGEFTDPRMKREIDDLKERRRCFLHREFAKNGQKEPTRANLRGIDPSHPAYLEQLIHVVDDNEFQKLVFDLDYKKGWLMLKYSSFYKRPEVQSLVKSIYKASPELRTELLSALKQIQQQKNDKGELESNPMLIEMADDLEEIISKRNLFLATLKSEQASEGLDRAASESIVDEAP